MIEHGKPQQKDSKILSSAFMIDVVLSIVIIFTPTRFILQIPRFCLRFLFFCIISRLILAPWLACFFIHRLLLFMAL